MDFDPLAERLRAWRERIRPEDVGLPRVSQRRTPGLRREELAVLAGVSPEYVVRLEQGRASNPSAQVVAALARALRLSASESEHLFRLAGLADRSDGRVPTYVSAGVMRVVDRLADSSAVVVCTAAWETVYWNTLWAALVGSPASAAGRERNFAWRYFAGELTTRLSHTQDVLDEFEHDMVCDLRRTAERYPGDAEVARMCLELRQRSDRFARFWDTGDVARHRNVRKIVHHPLVGPIEVDCDVLSAGERDLNIVVFTAEPGSEDASRLDMLRVMGEQAGAWTGRHQ